MTKLSKNTETQQSCITDVKCSDIVSDEQLEKAFGFANYGGSTKRDVIIDTLKKVAQSWHTGHTSTSIALELELIEKRNGTFGLSDKGLEYLLIYARS